MSSKSSSKSKQSSTGHSDPSGARIRSLIRKNLVASPDFPRLYAEVLESEGYNFNQAKDLAFQLQKKLGVYKPEKRVQTCSHIMVTGVRCQSPALRDKDYCYFHQRMLHGVALPRTRLNHVALLENEEAIQVSVMEVINGLMSGAIDLRRGELILRALNTAVRNSRRVRFNINAGEMVTEVPNYEQEAEALERSRQEVRTEIHRMRAEARQRLAEKTAEEKSAAPPANAQASTTQKSSTISAAAPKAAPVAPTQAPASQEAPAASVCASDSRQRKPPLGVKTAAEASERKTAVAGATSS
jgi:hypothetical protein